MGIWKAILKKLFKVDKKILDIHHYNLVAYSHYLEDRLKKLSKNDKELYQKIVDLNTKIKTLIENVGKKTFLQFLKDKKQSDAKINLNDPQVLITLRVDFDCERQEMVVSGLKEIVESTPKKKQHSGPQDDDDKLVEFTYSKNVDYDRVHELEGDFKSRNDFYHPGKIVENTEEVEEIPDMLGFGSNPTRHWEKAKKELENHQVHFFLPCNQAHDPLRTGSAKETSDDNKMFKRIQCEPKDEGGRCLGYTYEWARAVEKDGYFDMQMHSTKEVLTDSIINLFGKKWLGSRICLTKINEVKKRSDEVKVALINIMRFLGSVPLLNKFLNIHVYDGEVNSDFFRKELWEIVKNLNKNSTYVLSYNCIMFDGGYRSHATGIRMYKNGIEFFDPNQGIARFDNIQDFVEFMVDRLAAEGSNHIMCNIMPYKNKYIENGKQDKWEEVICECNENQILIDEKLPTNLDNHKKNSNSEDALLKKLEDHKKELGNLQGAGAIKKCGLITKFIKDYSSITEVNQKHNFIQNIISNKSHGLLQNRGLGLFGFFGGPKSSTESLLRQLDKSLNTDKKSEIINSENQPLLDHT